MNYIAEIEHEIDGIPFVIGVTYWESFVPGYISGPPEDCYPDEGGYGEWTIIKVTGQPYPWFQKQLTSSSIKEIDQIVYDYMEDRSNFSDDFDYDY